MTTLIQTQLWRSILHVNPDNDPRRDRPAREWMANPYRVHQRIMWALDGQIPTKEERGDTGRKDGIGLPLFRIFNETGAIIVQTSAWPDWNKAFKGEHSEAMFLLQDKPAVNEYCPDLEKTGIYLFQLLANPTKTDSLAPPPGGWRAAREHAKKIGEPKPKFACGKRRPFFKTDETLKWLEKRMKQSSGFELVPTETGRNCDKEGQEHVANYGVRVRETFTVLARKGHKSDDRPKEHKKPMKFHAAVFEGVVRVTDPERAFETIANGIGPAKGLGFGLLLLGNRLA
ncbi:MAG: type I-E CRISPR-associated protein Cas6/Cse3/CasE [Planctomycetes bacterium]|nr:type I-E CRISPR-associated protein Cas6/Cse3/CasE [Planctomycetota bacterium]